MSETGSVKFGCDHVVTELPPSLLLDELNACRRALIRMGVMGVDEKGIGFGNISARDAASGHFYITGSATGANPDLTPADYARVTSYDFANNWLRCEGVIVASSESLTHAAVYEADPSIGAVIHAHSAKLWRELIDAAPTTSAKVDYGTPGLAFEVQRLFRESDLAERKLFVMAGHVDGFVTFGANISEALAVLTTNVVALI